MAELAALSRRLDERLLHLLEALETLQGKRDDFNSRVEQGWFSLSKSRFAMGCKSVSALQYGAHMEPRVRVQASEAGSGELVFQVVPEASGPSAEAAASPAEEEIGPQEQALRRRKGPGHTADAGRPLEADAGRPLEADAGRPLEADAGRPLEADAGRPLEADAASSRDPLTWFGILVPQSLRQAQSSFKEGIRLAGEIATLQSDIQATRAQYQALLERKRQLLAREG